MKKKILFSIATCISIIVFFELLFQILSILIPTVDCRLLTRHCNYMQVVKDDKLGVRGSQINPEHDRNGFRNNKVPTEADIVALGDSNTYGYFVRPEEAWPKQLEKLSGKMTYNMAFGGYGPVHHLILYNEARSFNPKIIIQALYSGNDLYDAYNLVYNKGQHIEFKSIDRNILIKLKPSEEDLPGISELHGKSEKLNLTKTLKAYKRKILSYFKLYQFLRVSINKFESIIQSLNIPFNIWYSSPWESVRKYAEKHNYEIIENDKFRTSFTVNERLLALDLSTTEVMEGLRISHEAIKEINNRAALDGIEYIVLLIPTKEYIYKDIILQESFSMPQNYYDLIANEELVWQKTKEFLRNHQINFIDAAMLMEKYQKKGEDTYMKDHHGHINAFGYKVVAELISSHIKTSRLPGQ